MATDSTLQKIADNLLAQFDKTLLDNSTDFSSCDQILNAAPSEHKGGLESLYCDLLLDALISGYYRYSEMDTKQLVDDPLYTKFKKMVYGLDRSDPYNLLYYAIIDLVSGKKENVLQYLSAYLDEKIKSLKTESGIFTAEDFTYILVVPLKEGFPGMWSAIGRMLDRDDVEAGIPEKISLKKSRLTIRCGYLSTPFPIQRLSNEEGMYPARPSDQLDNPRFLE